MRKEMKGKEREGREGGPNFWTVAVPMTAVCLDDK